MKSYLKSYMNALKNIFFVCLLLLIGASFTGCEKQEEKIEFDNTYPLALSPSVEWAVVKEPYAAYKSEHSWEANVVGHCRRGEILQVLSRSVDENNEKWCCFEDGWLPESCLNIYSNRLKAERVSEILIKANEQKE